MHTTSSDCSQDIRLVRAVIDNYFHGLYHGDIEKLRGAFHKDARLHGYRNGTYTDISLNEWLERVSARPVPATSGERFEMSVESIDLTGAVGVAKVRDFYTGLQFTDYLSMIKVEGRWVIMNKLFHHD